MIKQYGTPDEFAFDSLCGLCGAQAGEAAQLLQVPFEPLVFLPVQLYCF